MHRKIGRKAWYTDMRIVFMGTPDFAVETLRTLLESPKHEVAAVVTQPDKPKGRGNVMQFPPVKELALEHQVLIYQPAKVRVPEFVEILKEIQPDVIVVVAFGQILSKEILEIPKYGCINVHASLLPKYRGAAPIQQAVIDGEKETGVTIMRMDTGVDTGDMIKKSVIPIERKETGESLFRKLSKLGGPLMLEVLEELEAGCAVFEKQDESMASHVRMLDKRMGKIDWKESAEKIERLVRGLNSWPSAYTALDGRILKIWDADVLEREYSGECGSVVEVRKDCFYVKTGGGTLAVKEVQLEGKKRMLADAFLRGYVVEVGKQLGV